MRASSSANDVELMGVRHQRPAGGPWRGMGSGITGRPPIQRAALPGRRLAAAMDRLPGSGQMDRVPVARRSPELARSGAGGAIVVEVHDRRNAISRKWN